MDERSKLTNEDVLAFLDERIQGSYKCELCTKDLFDVMFRDASNLVPHIGLFDIADPSFDLAHVRPYALVCCENCGNTKFIDAEPIAAWKAKDANG